MDVFCPGIHCTYQARDGQPLYLDARSHSSVAAVLLSEGLIRREFEASSTQTPRLP